MTRIDRRTYCGRPGWKLLFLLGRWGSHSTRSTLSYFFVLRITLWSRRRGRGTWTVDERCCSPGSLHWRWPSGVLTDARCDVRATLLVSFRAAVAGYAGHAVLARTLARRLVARLPRSANWMTIACCNKKKSLVVINFKALLPQGSFANPLCVTSIEMRKWNILLRAIHILWALIIIFENYCSYQKKIMLLSMYYNLNKLQCFLYMHYNIINLYDI